MTEYRICTRCIMDTTDPEIRFDADGHCNHCTNALARLARQIGIPERRQQALEALVAQVKREGKGKQYDCVIGVSGGADSTWVACVVSELGLRPLAVHFDNGWDTETSVNNIHRTLEQLNIELHTHVVDWEEFRDLQMAFLQASVPNCEIPTDHGITATLFRTAKEVGTRFILSGSNLASESIMPISWGHYNQDLKHLKAVHRRFGRRKAIKSFPTISLLKYLVYVFRHGIRQIPFLNYVDYDRDRARCLLAERLGWRDYGAKHYESVWTRFFQGHYLPAKFGFDKRRAHYSSLICSASMNREDALSAMTQPLYSPELLRKDLRFVLKKFGLSEAAWQEIMDAPPLPHARYPGHFFLLRRLERYKNIFRRIATTP